MKYFPIDPDFSAGGQPTPEELRELAQKGFRAVVNLRREGEDEQPLSPREEAEAAAEVRMKYVHIPVSLDQLKDEQLDQFRAAMQQLPTPVYVHCRGGGRARTFALTHQAIESGQSGAEAGRLLEQAGLLEAGDEVLREQLTRYVDRQRSE